MVATLPDDLGDLQPAGSYASTGLYLRRLWERRAYLIHVPRSNLRSRNMNTVFGNLWNLLNPVLSIAVYYLIFGVLLGTTRGVEYFIPFLAIGVFAYQYTQRSTLQGAKSIVSNLGLLRTVSFPRAMLPVTTVLTETLTFLPTIAVALAVTLIAGAPVSLTWLLVVPIVVLHLMFNLGCALVVARLNHSFRDVENLLPFLFRLLFYGSGVIFSVGAYLEDPSLRWIFIANPLFSFLALYRWAILDMPVVWTELVSVLIWSVALLIGGMWWFRRAEASYGG